MDDRGCSTSTIRPVKEAEDNLMPRMSEAEWQRGKLENEHAEIKVQHAKEKEEAAGLTEELGYMQ